MKRYVHEEGTARVRRLLREGRIVTSRISEVEIASALARRRREGVLAAAATTRALAALERDQAAWIIVEVTPTIAGETRALLERYDLRAGDAIQLASCVHVQRRVKARIPLLTFDERQKTAARAERVPVD